jgi:sphingosine kinase
MGQQRRLDIHTLIQKGRYLRLSQMHVLVEPINGPEAEQWVDLAMLAAYGGASCAMG